MIKNNQGLTLVEIIVSIALISIIALLFSNILISSIHSRNLNRERIEVLALATSYIDHIRTLDEGNVEVQEIEDYLIGEGFVEESHYYKLERADSDNFQYEINIYIEETLSNNLINLRVVAIPSHSNPITIPTIIRGAL
ncbi:prepilin-type N-terminal cleavage/methylation domain-containing protein [Natranaerovirga hydrolytica]|uniref:Prepilin-type N-terminal cleavage/methylation domain-containing protein n=1 Tax=Natranaerovirga hydrolytica TaxID=680378 RepID=A0A4R1N7P6_9FIRM|nr:type II secretion system protein [Natranaerovirga hydrolytica]TCK98693.1 prepilin-type N-terminal cleavage/methylation domain-containing protein [Natranaerovirga hydrolytica]